ncbi:MAG TPA: MFS transporter, partial [Thermomicrobiales bacterium]|nr:MFS transporter [Thermomicrobiales bacterium]
GWRWIFYINLPVGLVTLVLALLVIPDLRPGRRHRLDLTGVALATAGLFGVVFGLIEGQRYDWGTVWSFVTIPGIIGAGVVLLAAFVASQALRQNAEPLLPFAIFRDRNYTLMTVVLAAVGFAMLGLFLPLTIYFQSVLGLSALAAGLTIAPQALAMMLVAPLSGTLADRFGGKVVLIPGLTLFAAGMGYIGWIAQADSGRWSFLPGLLVSGVGMGCVWAPVYSIAMRDVEPRLAGVASGVISTIQELGGVLASAIVGALLQNRLALALHDRAVQDAAQLPAQFRGPFIAAFSDAAKGGLEVGAGQTGGALTPPPGLPAEVAQQLQRLAHDVFTHAFVAAMRPTLILPIVVVALAAMACFAIQRRRAVAVAEAPAVEEAVAA